MHYIKKLRNLPGESGWNKLVLKWRRQTSISTVIGHPWHKSIEVMYLEKLDSE